MTAASCCGRSNGGSSWSTEPRLPNATNATCKGYTNIDDINAVRFAGNFQAWLFGAGQGILRSSPGDPQLVGDDWGEANRDTKGTQNVGDDSCRINAYSNAGFADAFFASPSVAYIVEGQYSKVFFTANALGSAGQEKAADAGNGGTTGRVIAGDPENPNRMWSVDGQPYGRSTTAYTRDGWATNHWFEIGNPGFRDFPLLGPADVDFAGGTVLAAGDSGLILTSVDGVTFFYSEGEGTWRRSAGTRSVSPVASTAPSAATAADSRSPRRPAPSPRPSPPPRRCRRRSPRAAHPDADPAKDTRPQPSLKGSGATAKVVGGKVRIVVRGKLTRRPPGCSRVRPADGQEGQDAPVGAQRQGRQEVHVLQDDLAVRAKVGKAKKLVVTVRFAGNTVLRPTSQNMTVRVPR